MCNRVPRILSSSRALDHLPDHPHPLFWLFDVFHHPQLSHCSRVHARVCTNVPVARDRRLWFSPLSALAPTRKRSPPSSSMVIPTQHRPISGLPLRPLGRPVSVDESVIYATKQNLPAIFEVSMVTIGKTRQPGRIGREDPGMRTLPSPLRLASARCWGYTDVETRVRCHHTVASSPSPGGCSKVCRQIISGFGFAWEGCLPIKKITKKIRASLSTHTPLPSIPRTPPKPLHDTKKTVCGERTRGAPPDELEGLRAVVPGAHPP